MPHAVVVWWQNIARFDVVVVMSAGRVVEVGRPGALLAARDSALARLVASLSHNHRDHHDRRDVRANLLSGIGHYSNSRAAQSRGILRCHGDARGLSQAACLDRVVCTCAPTQLNSVQLYTTIPLCHPG